MYPPCNCQQQVLPATITLPRSVALEFRPCVQGGATTFVLLSSGLSDSLPTVRIASLFLTAYYDSNSQLWLGPTDLHPTSNPKTYTDQGLPVIHRSVSNPVTTSKQGIQHHLMQHCLGKCNGEGYRVVFGNVRYKLPPLTIHTEIPDFPCSPQVHDGTMRRHKVKDRSP